MAHDPAAVALFAFRRPDHLARTLASLAACAEAPATDLIAFSDGPRHDGDARQVDQVREVLAGAQGFRSVRVVAREQNLGLAQNVITGVSDVLSDRPEVIVLEDDMVVSPDFLAYMNSGLELYADEADVVSIHAYVYPTGEALPDSFFLRGADCWGWATWRRGWAIFQPDGQALLDDLEASGQLDEFDFGGAYGYSQMLREQIAGNVDSWAVRWYASAFLAGKLTLYPGRSLVENIGLDGTGTHSVAHDALVTSANRMPTLQRIPVEESANARNAVAEALRRQRTQSVWSRIRSRIGL